MFDARKTGMIGLPYGGKNYDDTLSRFHTIPACHGQTDGLAIAPVERALSCWHNFLFIFKLELFARCQHYSNQSLNRDEIVPV